jgi:hypothetical protein
MVLSLFAFGGLLVFGLPSLLVSTPTFGMSHTLGSLLTFFALEKLFMGANLVTLITWVLELFV